MLHAACCKYRTQKIASRHHRTTLLGYIFATKARIHNRKKLVKQQYISPTRPHNMVNFGPLAAENGLLVWGTQRISTGFMSWLDYCSDVAQRRSTKLCTMFGRLLGWYTIQCAPINWTTKLMAVTLSNLDRFSKSFHC